MGSRRETVKAVDGPSMVEPQTAVRLWDGGAPSARGADDADVPTLTPFLADGEKATGAAVVVCPGGGYSVLAAHEGEPVARWLNSLGVHALVLKYRLGPRYRHPSQMLDVQRAMRLVRSKASQWQVDPKRVGILGFSAGGHLASTAATHFDDGVANDADHINRLTCRPDLAILIYPVISMSEAYRDSGSRRQLLGDNSDPALELFLSNDRQVTAQTPPSFIVHGADDSVVPVEHSFLFAAACRQCGVPVELHVFEHGPHGFGLGGEDAVLSTWPAIAGAWLRWHKFARE